MISAAVTAYLILSAVLLRLSARVISLSRQHQLAFVAIIILLFGLLPQLRQPLVAPGIIFHLGLMLFTLHLSAYYSGTGKNSAHMYSLVLIMGGMVLAGMSHPVFAHWSLLRFGIMFAAWLLLLEMEKTLSSGSYTAGRMERNLLWIWFVSAVMGQGQSQAALLPDLIFPVVLILHLEKRWPRLTVPAPMIVLYGLLIAWQGHYILSGFSGDLRGVTIGLSLTLTQIVVLGLVLMLILLYGLTRPSITKQLFYLFLAQETLLLTLGLENIFRPTAELLALQRILLFVSLNGLFVMIESREDEGLEAQVLSGLFLERPRFSSSVILISSFFALYPLIYIEIGQPLSTWFILPLTLVGLFWAYRIIRLLLTRVERPYRILRPSLSIWATVVFAVLWAFVVVVEVFSRKFILNGV